MEMMSHWLKLEHVFQAALRPITADLSAKSLNGARATSIGSILCFSVRPKSLYSTGKQRTNFTLVNVHRTCWPNLLLRAQKNSPAFSAGRLSLHAEPKRLGYIAI